jgi:hypothetical protein
MRSCVRRSTLTLAPPPRSVSLPQSIHASEARALPATNASYCMPRPAVDTTPSNMEGLYR